MADGKPIVEDADTSVLLGNARRLRQRPVPARKNGTRLSQDIVNAIEPRAEAKLRLPDHEVKGLFIRVTPNGAKSYVLRYTIDGRRGETAIGDARSITLKVARKKALDIMGDVALHKNDPVQAKRKAAQAQRAKSEGTFASLEKLYSVDAARRKRPRTLEYERWLLDRHILPHLGTRPYSELRRAEIIAFVENVGDKVGAVTANRCHALVRLVLNFALKRDLIDANPALSIERLFAEKSRERILNDDEIRALWKFLEAARLGGAERDPKRQRGINVMSPATAIALQICFLTLQRASEIVGIRKEEVSLTDRLLIIPAERMKGKRAHAVPLSDLAVERLRQAFKLSNDELAFPARDGVASLDPKRLTRAMARTCAELKIPGAGPHDLRRTGRTRLTSERVGVSYEIAERVIAHLVGSAVSRVYDRNEYLKEKRIALDAWAAELKRIARPKTSPRSRPRKARRAIPR